MSGGVVGATLPCTSAYTGGHLTKLTIQSLCPCTAVETATFRINKVMNLLEVKAFSGNLKLVSKASAVESIGTGNLDLSTLTTLAQDSLTSCTMVRASPIQGTVTEFTLNFVLPSLLID